MQFEFAAILVALTLLTGIIWGLDRLFFAKGRAAETPPGELPREPVVVEYARSFFPVILIVMLFRSFIAEPFRIPSGSMMPTLLVGDFILVNKFSYGLRVPVVDKKILAIGAPERGDVSGYRNKTLYVNGKEVSKSFLQPYANSTENGWDGKISSSLGTADMEDMRLVQRGGEVSTEHLPGRDHRVAEMPGAQGVSDGSWTVPAGHYFAMGDNRDNSADSRVWGFVPEENLVGKAFVIWMSFRDFHRIGTLIK